MEESNALVCPIPDAMDIVGRLVKYATQDKVTYACLLNKKLVLE